MTSSSVVVMWQTSKRCTGQLRLLTAPERLVQSKNQELHELLIEDLEPSSYYRYHLKCDDWEAEGGFSTAPLASEPFSFVVYGDSRSNASAHRRVVERIRQDPPDFLLGTGDIVNKGDSSADWSKLFDIEGALWGEVPFFPALGNHDRQGRSKGATNFRKFFSLPSNSPSPERYYHFDFGNSRFIVLDSNAYSFTLSDQSEWLRQQLQSARVDSSIEHVFVAMHHPPFSVSLHGGQSELREAWTPLFEEFAVDAVFSGHDHVYSRAERHGVRYFVSGGGGAPLYGRKKDAEKISRDATRFFERVNHHLLVRVQGKQVEVQAMRADGTTMETIGWSTSSQRRGNGSAPESTEIVVHRPKPINQAQKSSKPAASEAEVESLKTMPTRKSAPYGLIGGLLALVAAILVIWAWRF